MILSGCLFLKHKASDLNSLIQESLKMSKFHHPNVLKLIGVCIDMGESPYIYSDALHD